MLTYFSLQYEAKKRLFNHAMQVLLALSQHEGDQVVVHSNYLPKLGDSKKYECTYLSISSH